MMSHFTLVRIGKLIQAAAEAENQVEIVRQVLCEKPDFEPFTAFRRISKVHTKITTRALYSFLKENGSNATKWEAYYLVRLFDSDQDGRLSYTEFLEIVLPRTNPELRQTVEARKVHVNDEDENLPYQIEHALVRIFEEELKFYRKCESIRQELIVCKDFSLINAFKEIDVRDVNYFDADDLVAFFQKIHKEIYDSQIASFMQRVDKDRDGKVRFSDFLDLFYSKEDERLVEKEEEASGNVSNRQEKANKYIARLREAYASPRVKYVSPSKKVMSPGESVFSPASTIASLTHQAVQEKPVMKEMKEIKEIKEVREPKEIKETNHRVKFAMTESELESDREEEQDFKRVKETKEVRQIKEVREPKEKKETKQPKEIKEKKERKQIKEAKELRELIDREIESAYRKTPPTLEERDELKLVGAFKEMVKHMHSLEAIKDDMAVKKDFNLYNAFAVFDVERRGSIDKKQLRRGLLRLDIELSQDELYLLMRSIDTDADGLIRFGDFSYVANPKSPETSKIMTSRASYYVNQTGDALKSFLKETLLAYREFWKALIRQEILLESLRQRLLKSKTFNYLDAFRALDRKDNGFLTAAQLGEFLKGRGLRFSKDDIISLVEKLTTNDLKKVSYFDFVKTLAPKSPEKY